MRTPRSHPRFLPQLRFFLGRPRVHHRHPPRQQYPGAAHDVQDAMVLQAEHQIYILLDIICSSINLFITSNIYLAHAHRTHALRCSYNSSA